MNQIVMAYGTGYEHGFFFVLSILKKGTGIEQRKKQKNFIVCNFFSTKNARVAQCGNYVKVIQEKKEGSGHEFEDK